MKFTFVSSCAVLILVSSLFAQQKPDQTKFPKQVVEEFVQIETSGGRLTLDGWRRASVFFVRPDPFTPHPKIFVIRSEFSVWDPSTRPSNRNSEILVDIDPLGEIDSKLRFKTEERKFAKTSLAYKLALASSRWTLKSDGELDGEQSVPPQWLISDPNDSVTLTVSAATRYVAEQRSQTADPALRTNADQTLSKLKTFKR
jgi:hypothetical protein